MSCTESVHRWFGEIWKRQWVQFCLGRRLTLTRLPKPGQWPCGRCLTWFGGDVKASIERLCLSPYVEKPFNSKVIKSFVPELRSCKCFCVLGFLCSMYICYEHSMYTSHIRIWLCYRYITQKMSKIALLSTSRRPSTGIA